MFHLSYLAVVNPSAIIVNINIMIKYDFFKNENVFKNYVYKLQLNS